VNLLTGEQKEDLSDFDDDDGLDDDGEDEPDWQEIRLADGTVFYQNDWVKPATKIWEVPEELARWRLLNPSGDWAQCHKDTGEVRHSLPLGYS
jgi:hypothetical protein